MSFRLLPLVIIAFAIFPILLLQGAGASEGQARNPAAAGGDGEAFAADNQFPVVSEDRWTRLDDIRQPAGMICCGVDERVQIADSTQFPWRIISYLQLYDQNSNLYGSCTGTFIGPNTLLTAAHCLYSAQDGFIGDIAVYPGANLPDLPYGYQFASNWWVPDAWIYTGGDPLFDWGVIKMPDSAYGNALGWLPVVSMSTSTLSRPDFTPAISGYPGDKPIGTQWLGAKNAFLAVNDFTLEYLIDTAAGQSGAAIFSANLQEDFGGAIVGIHAYGSSSFNSGTRIDETLLQDILYGCYVMSCSISAFVEGGSTVTPGPTPSSTPTNSPTGTPTQSPTPSPTPTPSLSPTPTGSPLAYRQGDANCSGGIDPGDITTLLKRAIGLALAAGCATYQDDVNCLNGTDAMDALGVAIYLAEADPLPVNGNCTPIGGQLSS